MKWLYLNFVTLSTRIREINGHDLIRILRCWYEVAQTDKLLKGMVVCQIVTVIVCKFRSNAVMESFVILMDMCHLKLYREKLCQYGAILRNLSNDKLLCSASRDVYKLYTSLVSNGHFRTFYFQAYILIVLCSKLNCGKLVLSIYLV